MAKKAKQKRSSQAEGSSSSYMTYVLLALTAVVVGLTVYVGVFMKEAETKHPPPPKGTSELQRVLTQARNLMAMNRPAAYAGAASLMGTYVRRYPMDVEVRPLLAEALFKAGRTEQAEHTIDDLLKLTKPTGEALWLKGELVRLRQFRQYSMELAGALWLNGLATPPRPRSSHISFFRRAAEADTGTRPEIWLKFAVELLRADKHDLAGQKDLIGRREELAEQYLNKALDAGLRDVRTLAGLGELALKRESFEQAAKMLAEATRQNPKDFELWRMLAQAQKEAGMQLKAAESIQQALKLRRSRDALILKGQIDQLRGRRAEAAEAFAEAAADPRLRPQASFWAARCYYHVEKYALAMKYIDIAASLMPDKKDVVELRRKIEDERFGPADVEATPKTDFRLGPE